jgi:DNA-binding CsgD family transcriptional regulator
LLFTPYYAPMDQALRAIERRVRHLAEQGMSEVEIARRFRRSPGMIRRVIEMSDLPRTQRPAPHDVLRPLERRVLQWRANGAHFPELGARFRSSPAHMERVENLARYKLSRAGQSPS